MSFTPDQLVHALSVPLANAIAQWPLVTAALAAHGIDDRATEIAAAGTIAVETPQFWPIAEYGGAHAWYAPYFGRGLIQLSLKENYVHYGQALGVDLVDNPDLALRDDISAKVLGLYFAEHGISALANAGNWTGVRQSINGGSNGLPQFLAAVAALEAQPWPPNAPPVTTVAVADHLYQGPVAAPPYALGPGRKPVTLAVGTVVHFTGKVTPHWAEITIDKSVVHGWYLRANLKTV